MVLLNFWTKWCHGCKPEIPLFCDFNRKYGAKGLAVIGISLDEEGWKTVKPFTKKVEIPYVVILGNAELAKINVGAYS